MVLNVYCRVKDKPVNFKILNDNICNLTIPYKKKQFEFNINHIFQNVDNQAVFNKLMQHDSNKNYWVLFGFTGTGKTYTTNGILNELLRFYKNNIQISAIQIYNNDVYDLISNKKLKYYKTNKLVIRNKKIKRIDNQTDIQDFIKLMHKNRSQNKTDFNSVSSRSHAIITILIKDQEYTIVDMAGQESGVNYQNKKIQQEGACNNLNMLALKECIRSYYNNDKYIPYRRTLLTFALKPMFNLQHNTSFICTISTEMPIYNQIDSLKYANQLFECSKNETVVSYDHFLRDYNKYIIDSGWYTSNDIKIWREIKKKNYKNIKHISSYLNKKMNILQNFKNILNRYQKINPEFFDIEN